MKKLLLLFALSLCCSINSQTITDDDMLHFAGGAVVSSGTYALVYGKTKNKSKAFWYSLGASALAGVAKELLDQHAFEGDWNTSEAIATVAGGLTASLTFTIFTGKNKKKEKERYKQQASLLAN